MCSVRRLLEFQGYLVAAMDYLDFVYPKTVDSVFRALLLAAQSRNTLHYSLIHFQFPRATDASYSRKLRAKWLPGLLPSVNKEISQIIKQAAPEIDEEGYKSRFESFNR